MSVGQNFRYPNSASVTAVIPAVGPNNSPIPGSSILIGAENPGGNLIPLSVDSSGNLLVNLASPASPLAVNLTQVGGSSVSLGQALMAASLPVVLASNQSILNVVQPDVVSTGSITSNQSVTLNVNGLGSAGIQITGTWTGFISFSASVDGVNFGATSALVLSTGAIVGAVTGNGIWTIQTVGMQAVRVSGTTVATGTAVVTIRGGASVSSVMLDNPIPTGTNVIGQVTQSGTWSTRTQDGSGNPITSTASALDVNLKTSSITLPVSGSGNFTVVQSSGSNLHVNVDNFPATQPVSGTVTANQGTSPWADNISQFGGSSVSLGQKTSASSMPVVLASDQSSIPVAATAKTPTAGTVTQAAITVGTTAVRLTVSGSAPSATRSVLVAIPDGASTAKFYVGSSSVTSSGSTRGIQIVGGQSFTANNDAGDYYIVSDTASQTVYVLEQS